MHDLKPSDATLFVVNALKCGQIPYLAGPPGIGKSDIMHQVAKDSNLVMLDIRLSQKLPEDLTGLPSMDDKLGKAVYIPFDTFPMEGDKIPKGFNGWLIFLDELSSASEEVWAAIYSLLLGRMVGGKKIHEMAFIVAAGNRSTDSAIARPLPDTLITRMLCANMCVSHDDWLDWAKTICRFTNQTVTDFISKYSDMLLGVADPTARGELESYPTPRGWGTVFKIVNLLEKDSGKIKGTVKRDTAGIPLASPDIPGAVISEPIMCLLNAAVGTMAAQSFREHYDEAMHLPYPWDVAQSPSSIKIPSTAIGRAKLTNDLAEFFIDTKEQSRDALLQFMNRMESEYISLFAQTITEKIGSTQSDQRMIKDLNKRLSIDKILMPTIGYDDED